MHLQMAWSSAGPYSGASDVRLSPHEMVGPSSTYSAGQRANTNGPDRTASSKVLSASGSGTNTLRRHRSPIHPSRRSSKVCDPSIPPDGHALMTTTAYLHVSNCVDLTWEGSIRSTRSIVKPAGVPGPEGQSRPNGAEEQDSAKYGDVPDYWMTRQQ